MIQLAPGDSIAVVSPETGVTLTYDELRRQVTAAADLFASAGIGKGDRVAIALPNGIPILVCFLAASIAGTAAPLNPAYRHDEFVFYLADTNAKLLIVPPEGGEAALGAAGSRIPVYMAAIVDGKVTFRDESGTAPLPTLSAPDPDPDQIALILHTSGSTGLPKRVPIPHRNLAISAANIAAHYQLTPSDVSLCVMPLFHVHGLVASVLATLYSEGHIIVPGKFNALSFWRTVRDYGATWYSAVPTIHHLLLARAGGERPAGSESLRFIRSCSAALSPDQMRQMEEVFGVPVLEAYGMTEASHQMASNPLPPHPRKPGSVGLGTGVHLGIMDAAGNIPSREYDAAKWLSSGASVVEGYENNPEANAASFTNGWFRTGDQGILDDDGYLTLTGRLKELINRGGEKIAPRELDEVLAHAIPRSPKPSASASRTRSGARKLRPRLRCAPRFPQARPDLLAFCKERLADFKRPKKIHIVEHIPRTATGKIQRRVVAAAFAS